MRDGLVSRRSRRALVGAAACAAVALCLSALRGASGRRRRCRRNGRKATRPRRNWRSSASRLRSCRRRPSRRPRPRSRSIRTSSPRAAGTRCRRAASFGSARRARRSRLCASGWSPRAISIRSPGRGRSTIPSSRPASSASRPATASTGRASSTRTTLAALNVPPHARLQQLQTNLVRLRSYSGDLGPRFVIVNLPGGLGRDGRERRRLFASRAPASARSTASRRSCRPARPRSISTRSGHVPPSLIKKDLIPKMKADPNYLADEKIHIFDRTGRRSRRRRSTGTPTRRRTSRIARTPAPTSTRSASCASTSRIPTASTCTTRRRRACSATISASCRRAACAFRTCATMSPGCSRTIRAGAATRSTRSIRSGQRVDVKLAQPVNVYWVYITAWATPDGLVQFRPDIYQRDGAGPGPIASAVPDPADGDPAGVATRNRPTRARGI